jgi:glycosyltransferase involved in cell wall biosynthesis
VSASRLSPATASAHSRLTAETRPSEASKTLSIVHVLAPNSVGGLETVVLALAIGQARSGHTVRVIAVETPGADTSTFTSTLDQAGVEVLKIPVRGRGYLVERAAVAAICRRIRPDVVHTHGYRPDVVDGPAIKRLGIATVSTIHGLTNHQNLKGRFFHWLQARALRGYDAVVVVSRPLVGAYTERGITPNRIHCVPNGWGGPTPFSREEARASLGIGQHELAVGWIGRLSIEKGADVFIDAMAHVARRRAGEGPLKTIVIGDGPERQALCARADSLGLTGHQLQWLGVVTGAGRLAAAFDVIVLSSRSEGTPIALLEAMAAGAPVVATSVGGVPDVVGSGEALLVPPDEPRALAAAIEDTLRHRADACVRATAARERLKTEYDLSRWLSRYDRLYRALRRDSEALARAEVLRPERSRPQSTGDEPADFAMRER